MSQHIKWLRTIISLPAWLGFSSVLGQLPAEAIAAVEMVSSCPDTARPSNGMKTYDVIVFGDQVPGVMTAIQVKRELKKRNQSSRVLLITEGDTTKGIGGHLVRGGLAYLDRNQVPRDLRSSLGAFAAASPLYQEFLDITGTETIALDRFKAAEAFKQVLAQTDVDVLGKVSLKSVTTTIKTLCSFTTVASGAFAAKEFIDASQGAKFTEMAGVKVFPGFAALGLPDSSLSIGLVFETYGLTIDQLKQLETKLTQRLQNSSDTTAQTWLKAASRNDLEERQTILTSLTTHAGEPAVVYQATPDSGDVRSLALTAAFHGGENLPILNPQQVFDRANIAVLRDRLSFNALLFYVDAAKARELSHTGSKPEAYMVEFAEKVKKFFLEHGAKRVEIMNELYIRSTEQIANPVEELSATRMTDGGVPADEAIGTFSYHLDVRGGIKGLGTRAASAGIKTIDFHYMPTFNYGFRHTLPKERENLAVLSPASGFGGLGEAAGRIVEFNVSVGQGLAVAVAKAIAEKRSLHTITHQEVRKNLGYTPTIYGRPTQSFHTVFLLEKTLRTTNQVARVATVSRPTDENLSASLETVQTRFNRGVQHSEKGNYLAAIAAYTQAIANELNNPLTYYNRGVALTHLHRYDAAIADYTNAIRLKPDFVAAHKNRGLVYIQSHKHLKESVADYNQAIKLAPNDATNYLGKGLALSLQGKRQEAIEPLMQAIKLKPDLAIAYFTLASVYVDLGDRSTALTHYQKAASLYQQQGNQVGYQNTLGAIKELQQR